MEKRGQFFLLAAVIISVVILSLSITTNRAIVNEEPGSFYDFSYEVKREIGAVMDYEIYTNVSGGDIDDFVDLLADDIKERSPGSDFMLIYSSDKEVKLKNYGAIDAYVGNNSVPVVDEVVDNKVCFKKICQDIPSSINNFGEDFSYVLDQTDIDNGNIDVTFKGNDFSFPLSRYKQVIFIMQKDVGDETFIASE
ncbi:MAG: hypothetical protein V1888_03195 [archaeon]